MRERDCDSNFVVTNCLQFKTQTKKKMVEIRQFFIFLTSRFRGKVVTYVSKSRFIPGKSHLIKNSHFTKV